MTAEPTILEVAHAVSAVVLEVEQIAATDEGKAALEAAVEYASAEGHDE